MKIRKFQEGGMAPEQAAMEQAAMEQQGGAPAQGQEGGNPEEQLMMVAQDIISQMGPEMAAMLAQIIMEMLQGGGAPQEQPVFARRGGKLTRIK
jgi:hypothetical protein